MYFIPVTPVTPENNTNLNKQCQLLVYKITFTIHLQFDLGFDTFKVIVRLNNTKYRKANRSNNDTSTYLERN